MIPRIDVTVAPTAEVISLDQAKTHLRVTNAFDDDYISSLIIAVRETFEELTGRITAIQSLKITMDYFPGGKMGWWDGTRDGALSGMQSRFLVVPRPPTISITEVATYGLTNDRTVYDPSNYFLDNSSPNMEARICLNIGSIWPVDLRRQNAVEILCQAGYASVPQRIIQVMLKVLSWQYEHRGDVDDESFEKSGVMGSIRALLIRKVGSDSRMNHGC